MKIGLRSDLCWPKVGLETKFHEPGTLGGFGKREQTDRQDSCFISIDYYICIDAAYQAQMMMLFRIFVVTHGIAM